MSAEEVVDISEDEEDLFDDAHLDGSGGVAEELVDPSVPRGPRSLLDICQGLMMRHQARYDDVGHLMYFQHPRFFETLGVDQLREIEYNSPTLRSETDCLWRKFAAKMDPANGANFKDEETKSWRKAYRVLEKIESRRRVASATAARQMYMEEEQAKKARSMKKVDQVVGSRAGIPRVASGSGSWGGSGSGPKTPLAQIKEKTARERQARILATTTAATATDRLVRSLPSTTPDMHAAGPPLRVSSMFRPTGRARREEMHGLKEMGSAGRTVLSTGLNVRQFGPDPEALSAPKFGTAGVRAMKVYETAPSPAVSTARRITIRAGRMTGSGAPAAQSPSLSNGTTGKKSMSPREISTRTSTSCDGLAPMVVMDRQDSSRTRKTILGMDGQDVRKGKSRAIPDVSVDAEEGKPPSSDRQHGSAKTDGGSSSCDLIEATRTPGKGKRGRDGELKRETVDLLDVDDVSPSRSIPPRPGDRVIDLESDRAPRRAFNLASRSASGTIPATGGAISSMASDAGRTMGLGYGPVVVPLTGKRRVDSSLFIPKPKRKKVG